MEMVECESDAIGSFIVSKSVGNYESQDVTKLYKLPYGKCQDRHYVLQVPPYEYFPKLMIYTYGETIAGGLPFK